MSTHHVTTKTLRHLAVYKIAYYDRPERWILVQFMGYGERTLARTLKCRPLAASHDLPLNPLFRPGWMHLHNHEESIRIQNLKDCIFEEVLVEDLPLYLHDDSTKFLEKLIRDHAQAQEPA